MGGSGMRRDTPLRYPGLGIAVAMTALIVVACVLVGIVVVHRIHRGWMHIRSAVASQSSGPVQALHVSRRIGVPSSIDRVDIDIPSGVVFVTGDGTSKGISVDGTYQSGVIHGLSAAQQFKDDWRVSVGKRSQVLTVSFLEPQVAGVPSPQFVVHLALPKRLAVQLQSANADATLTDLVHGVNIADANGAVQIQHVTGSVIGRFANANCHMSAIHGDIEARSTNGTVMVDGASGAIDLDTVNGNLRVVAPNVNGNIKLSSSNGSIQLQLSHQPSLALVAKTMGTVRGNLSWRRRGPHLMSARIGAGRHLATLSTRHGDIDVEFS